MLKARNPRLYAEFITILARQLREIILQNYGIFDKFTGDGVLAFFPDFYTGKDAGYFALKAANDCHEVFAEHYASNKHCFTSILKDIGLGIGIDYGEVQIVQIGGDFTVVGTPVVYACRMGGADAGHTYLNQPAFEKLFESYSAICDFDECEITIKHEGKTLAYGVELNGKGYEPDLPEWTKDSERQSRTNGQSQSTKKG
jgi:class 3 adenylate cyclase